MAEYIERNAAIRALTLHDCDSAGAKVAILDLPAANVAPVLHGEWIPFHSEAAGDIQYCSICKIGFESRTDFCPHCGAKMDEEVEDAK